MNGTVSDIIEHSVVGTHVEEEVLFIDLEKIDFRNFCDQVLSR
jgi:hypothetical protein